MTKQEWLINRDRILTGQLTQVELEQFFEMFIAHCKEDYKTTDFTTFSNNFTKWFFAPTWVKDGKLQITSQDAIVNSLIKYYDLKYNIMYLYDKESKLIKVC